jgi:predicted deacylase
VNLKKLYPDRLVQASPAEKPAWDRLLGAVVFFRKADTPLDLAPLEAFAATGRPVVMDLPLYARARGLRVRETTGADAPQLRIVNERPATQGFHPGDSIPWFAGKKGAWTQRVLEGDFPAERVLAQSSRGGALLVAEQAGKGTLLATDLTGADEPVWNQPGSLNKYLFLGNLLGATVRYGTFFPERLKYADFVKAMQAAAKELPALRFEEEGPAVGEYKLCSLNLGDPQKPAFFLYGATHGSEWESAYGLLALARRLASRPEEKLFDAGRYCLKIIPIINPSGYDLFTRQNAAKVDLNRNGGEWWASFKGTDSNKDGVWGPGDYDWKGAAPFSEPETQTFRAVCERVKPYATLDFHGNGGGRGNNRCVVLPLLARDDNEERAQNAVRLFNEAMRDRYILQQAFCTEADQYTIETVGWDSQRPTIIETAAKGRYGFLCEVPAGYQGTYGIVMQTDIVIETCLAFFKAYQE